LRFRVGTYHFTVDDPGGTVPRGSVEGGPQVEEEDGRDTAGREAFGSVVDGIGDGNVATDIPEAQRATNSTNEQHGPTAEVVDEDGDPNKSENSLDDTEDTGGEETGVGAADAEGAEDGGGIVVDGVDARAVLPEEELVSC
jgi:hypothetical protein